MTANSFARASRSHGASGRLSDAGASRPPRSALSGHGCSGERVVHSRRSPTMPTRYLTTRGAASAVEIGGVRTLLVVPLRKDDALLGVITVYPPGGPAVHRQADRAAAEFRGAGGHRDGECAADHRDARGAGAADRDRRGVAGHQLLARRSRAGVRRDAGKGDASVRGRVRQHLWTYDGEHFRCRRDARRARGVRRIAAAGPTRSSQPGLALRSS